MSMASDPFYKWCCVPLRARPFFGNALFPGGDGYPVRKAGIEAISVRDVIETKATYQPRPTGRLAKAPHCEDYLQNWSPALVKTP